MSLRRLLLNFQYDGPRLKLWNESVVSTALWSESGIEVISLWVRWDARVFETKMKSSLLAVKGLFLHHVYSFSSRCNVLQLSVKSRSDTRVLKASTFRLLCFSPDMMSSSLSRTELKSPIRILVCSSRLYLVLIFCIWLKMRFYQLEIVVHICWLWEALSCL